MLFVIPVLLLLFSILANLLLKLLHNDFNFISFLSQWINFDWNFKVTLWKLHSHAPRIVKRIFILWFLSYYVCYILLRYVYHRANISWYLCLYTGAHLFYVICSIWMEHRSLILRSSLICSIWMEHRSLIRDPLYYMFYLNATSVSDPEIIYRTLDCVRHIYFCILFQISGHNGNIHTNVIL